MVGIMADFSSNYIF